MDTKSSDSRIYTYLEKIHDNYNGIAQQLSSPEITGNSKKYQQLSKELYKLKHLEEKYQIYKLIRKQIDDSHELLLSSTEDDFKQLAEAELAEGQQKLAQLEVEIKIALVSDVVEDNRNVFLEIRAGAGGDEASLFAADLLRMYNRIAERKGWKAEIVSTTYSSIGGIKEIIIYIRGSHVNKYLKFESGVHRVQRVPITEASGRIHTSTVTVAVLPEVEDVEIDLNMKDVRIDTYAASGPGGQHVNKTESAIRITHFLTGIVVTCQDEKSQHKNKDKALKILKARLYEYEKDKQQEDIAENRRSQVGSGERSEKIRTYNFPQSRATDHRIGRNFNVEFVMDGDLDELVTLLTNDFTQRQIAEKMDRVLA